MRHSEPISEVNIQGKQRTPILNVLTADISLKGTSADATYQIYQPINISTV